MFNIIENNKYVINNHYFHLFFNVLSFVHYFKLLQSYFFILMTYVVAKIYVLASLFYVLTLNAQNLMYNKKKIKYYENHVFV